MTDTLVITLLFWGLLSTLDQPLFMSLIPAHTLTIPEHEWVEWVLGYFKLHRKLSCLGITVLFAGNSILHLRPDTKDDLVFRCFVYFVLYLLSRLSLENNNLHPALSVRGWLTFSPFGSVLYFDTHLLSCHLACRMPGPLAPWVHPSNRFVPILSYLHRNFHPLASFKIPKFSPPKFNS